MTTMQWSLFDDEPMVEVTAKGKRVAPKLKAQSAIPAMATATSPTATAGAGSGAVKAAHNQLPHNKPAKPAARPVVAHQPEVPLGPEAQLVVSRIPPLQPVVRVALLEMLAVAAMQEAEAQRALLTREVYPLTVNLNVEMLSNGVQGILDSPAVLQAMALNVLCASVPDEPIPEPSKEYLEYLAAEEARKVAQASRPTTTAAPSAPASTPQTSQQPADQFGMDGAALQWPSKIPGFTKPFKDGKARPISPLVLLVGSRSRAYDLPKLALASVQYATSQQVRVKFFDQSASERSIMQDGCYCVPTQTHLQRVVEGYSAYQTALTSLATVLREIGTYAQRLREACDIEDGKTAPTQAQITKLAKQNAGLERLCDHVICAPEPDKRSWAFGDPFKMPEVTRSSIFRHTPLCYQKYQGGGTISQGDTFPCLDDATWTRVDAAVKAAATAQTEWLALLAELGSYKVAAIEKRYAAVDAAMAQAAPASTTVSDMFSPAADDAEGADGASGDDDTDTDEAVDDESADTEDEAVASDESATEPPAEPHSFGFEELEAVGNDH